MIKRLGLMLGVISLLLLCGCESSNTSKHRGKVQVYTSMYPLEDFAKKIGGIHVEVTNLVPAGVEPHDFEISPRDMVKVSDADVLIYNGAGFEDWVEKTLRSLDEKKIAIVNTSDGLDLMRQNGRIDPHIWLDPKLAKAQAESIKAALVKVDATHKEDYERNYLQIVRQFDQLDMEYRDMVKRSSKKEFVVSHAAFYYLANRYGLKQIAVTGISPLEEPSAKELQLLIQTMKNHKVKYIFFETLVNNKMAKVIKKITGVESLILNPLEGLTEEELGQGADYFSVMKRNKENLAKALGEQ